MLSKRGSHVGVILSFMIFIVFVVFLFSALQPALKIEKDKEAILEYLTSSIVEMSSDNVTIENIVVDTKDDCVEIEKLESDRNILVKDADGNLVDYNVEGGVGGKIKIKTSAEKSLFKIYYSNSITPQSSLINCPKINGKDFEIGFVDKEEIVFISKFEEATKKDYSQLKKDLGVGEGTDFSFSLLDVEKKIVNGTEEKEISTNVYVNEFPVLYSDENGEIKSGFINVKVW